MTTQDFGSVSSGWLVGWFIGWFINGGQSCAQIVLICPEADGPLLTEETLTLAPDSISPG